MHIYIGHRNTANWSKYNLYHTTTDYGVRHNRRTLHSQQAPNTFPSINVRHG